MFKDINSAVEWLNSKKKLNKRYDLNVMRNALNQLDNPHMNLKYIHVGGTNGKGSTSTYISNILIDSGYKVGLYISPYVVKFNERLSINNEYISDANLLSYINKLFIFCSSFEEKYEVLGFFEVVTLISFLYFRDEKVDICVYEVGLGGRLDATNVISPLISSITNIQKDHEAQLGKTYKSILKEKLGIVKNNVPLVTSIRRKSLINDIKEKCNETSSKLYFVDNVKNIKLDKTGTTFKFENKYYKSSLIGIHQAYNASLAIKVIEVLNDIYNFNISDLNIKNGLKNSVWPGRFELFNDSIILDGAHNPMGQLLLKKSMLKFTKNKVNIVFCAMKDKDTKKMISIIDSYANSLILTKIDYYRSENSDYLMNLSSLVKKYEFNDYTEAIKFALNMKKKEETLLFTGSLYFISKVREILLEKEE